MIKIGEAESYLKNKIGDYPINIENAWKEFKSFGREQIEGEDEVALLFQCGVFDFTGEKLFYFDFVRQFAVYDGEEDSHIEQLHCEYVFEPTENLINLQTTQWYFDYEGDVEDFYTKIENLKEFKIPMSKKPLRFKIFQEKV